MKSQAFRVALLGLMGTTAAAPSEVKRASLSGSSLIAALAELSDAMEPVIDPLGQIIASLLNLNTNSGYRSSSGVLQGDLSHQMSQVARGMTSDDMIDYISSTAARRAKKAGGSSGFIMVPYSGAETTDDLTTRSTDAIDPLSSLLGSILNPTSTSGNLLTNLISGSLPSASNNPVASLISGVVSGVTSALPTSGAVASILKNLSPTGTVASLLSAIIPTSLPNLGLTAGLNLTPGAFINNLVNTIQQGLQKIAALISSTKLTLMNVIIKPKLVTEEVRALAHGILFVTVESLLASSAGLTTVGTSPSIQASVKGIISGLDGLYSAVTGTPDANSALSDVLDPMSSILSTATGMLNNTTALPNLVQNLLNATGNAVNSTVTGVLGGVLGAIANLGNTTKAGP